MIENNTTLSRKEKALITREKIYASADKLFALHGFENVNIDEIVQDAGVAKGSFYVHFESKDALIALFISNYVKKVDMDYEAYIQTLSPDLRADAVLMGLVGKIADVLDQEIGVVNMRFLYKIYLTNEAGTASLLDYNRELYLIFNNILSKGIVEGVFHSDLPVERLARHFVTAYRGLVYEWCVRFPDFGLKTEALEHFEITLKGLYGAS